MDWIDNSFMQFWGWVGEQRIHWLLAAWSVLCMALGIAIGALVRPRRVVIVRQPAARRWLAPTD